MILLLKLILAHILGDFVFQPDKWVNDKRKNKWRSPYLYGHIFIHSVLLILLFEFDLFYWKALLIVITSHFIIDLGKIYLEKNNTSRLLFTLDQIIHLFIILTVVYIYEPFSFKISFLNQSQFLLLLIALLMVSMVSAVIMKMLMSKWKLEEDNKENSLPKAGKHIGILERLFVFIFIVVNQWQAIGFLIAAKSVFRFSDISRAKDRKLTEYILIGTLLSFGLAILTGLLYLYLVDHIY